MRQKWIEIHRIFLLMEKINGNPLPDSISATLREIQEMVDRAYARRDIEVSSWLGSLSMKMPAWAHWWPLRLIFQPRHVTILFPEDPDTRIILVLKGTKPRYLGLFRWLDGKGHVFAELK